MDGTCTSKCQVTLDQTNSSDRLSRVRVKWRVGSQQQDASPFYLSRSHFHHPGDPSKHRSEPLSALHPGNARHASSGAKCGDKPIIAATPGSPLHGHLIRVWRDSQNADLFLLNHTTSWLVLCRDDGDAASMRSTIGRSHGLGMVEMGD
jgi:hypothetical protein